MKKIGIIGSGISGLSCAWLLNKHGHDVTVFEKNTYTGGHSNTVQVKGHPAIDTGFIVFNDLTYPNLIALFDELDVRTINSDMSFAVSFKQENFEYSSNALFKNPKNRFSLSYYQMLFDIVRFYKMAPYDVKRSKDLSLGEYLKKHRYSTKFIQHHLLPMGAAIWSMGSESMNDFPAKSFIQFFVNHGLFRFFNRPQWKTVLNGSREYVRKISTSFEKNINLNEEVLSVIGTKIKTSKAAYEFDHIVFACHSDQVLKILKDDLRQDEKNIIKRIPYSNNTAFLHQDESFMPQDRNNWASWNYLASSNKQITLTYWMNKLQPFINESTTNKQNYFVTLNPKEKPKFVLKEIHYEHPIYKMDALDAQSNLKQIQGNRKLWFCGAWNGYGFHEDGLVSGLKIAEAISGKTRPWVIEQEKSSSAVNTL